MELLIIIFLILLGVFLVVVEILLLPGITIAAFGAVASFTGAVVMSYHYYEGPVSEFVLLSSFILTVIALIFSLRAKTLKKLSLESKIESRVSEDAKISVSIGEYGVTVTRLGPMGTVSIGDKTYQGKSYKGLIDSNKEVVVTAFEDSVVVVERK